VVAELLGRLGDFSPLASAIITAVTDEVPAYAGLAAADLQLSMDSAVKAVLHRLRDAYAPGSGEGEVRAPGAAGPLGVEVALDLVEDFGRRAALAGRSLDAMLAVYRVGGRVTWAHLSAVALELTPDPALLAGLASQVFSAIDELSAASVRGYYEQLGEPQRERQRRRAVLAHHLAEGASEPTLREAAESAGWPPPATLTAVVLARHRAPTVRAALSEATLETDGGPGAAVLFVPGVDQIGRLRLRRTLRAVATSRAPVAIGPTVPWPQAHASLRVAGQALTLIAAGALHPTTPEEQVGVFDTQPHLGSLLVLADPITGLALVDSVLGPLWSLRHPTRDRLIETLGAWLRHRGSRDGAARELQIHPQTVRYRMTQVREALGAVVDAPERHLDLLLACAIAASLESSS